MNDLIGLTITGIISGIFGGFIGAGAEILIVPLLTICGVFSNIKTRIGTSLIMLLPPIGIFAAIQFYKNGFVNIYSGFYLAVIFTLFSYISSLYSIKFINFL